MKSVPLRLASLFFALALAGCMLADDEVEPAPEPQTYDGRVRLGLDHGPEFVPNPANDVGFGRQIPDFPGDRIRVAGDSSKLVLRFYDVGDVVSNPPDFPAPELGLNMGVVPENPYRDVLGGVAQSTFGVDVDTASYTNVRRFLNHQLLPPPQQVRIEELINYFPYAYDPPQTDEPFATHVDVAACPWSPSDRLVRIGLKGKVVERSQRPPTNLVFLVDVSGSMSSPEKLPLLKRSLRLLVRELGESDRVAMVVYAGAAGLVLPSTSCADSSKILGAIDRLESGGSTNGGAGIELAYQTAVAGFIEGGVNRVVLATDGDFNVGIERESDLEAFIAGKAKTGVFLSVLGFGPPSGDGRMEALADRGNGNYAGIDSLREAKKVLVEQMGGTLVTIAKDVKVRVTWDRAQVARYRLIGYENRVLKNEEFDDDKVDAGDIGAGHSVTALYQVVLAEDARKGGKLLDLELRTKLPDGEKSTLQTQEVHDAEKAFAFANPDLRFASAVAAFGMLLRRSEHAGSATYAKVRDWAKASLGDDPGGYRAEFLELVEKAQGISGERAKDQSRARAAKEDGRG